MYKKLVTFLVFSLYAPLAAFSADDPSRARLYIPVSTNVTFEDCTTCKEKQVVMLHVMFSDLDLDLE